MVLADFSRGSSPVDALYLNWSIIPVTMNEEPMVSLDVFQRRRPSIEEVEAWMEMEPPAWAVVTGQISGLVVLYCDKEVGDKTFGRHSLWPNVLTDSGDWHIYIYHPGWPVKPMDSLTIQFPGLGIKGDGDYAVFFGRSRRGEYRWRWLAIPSPPMSLAEDLRKGLGLAHPPDNEDLEPKRVQLKLALARTETEDPIRIGYELGCQLKDLCYEELEARKIMVEYARKVRRHDSREETEPYTEKLALDTLHLVYNVL